ncbi:hypothetical protein VKT23_016309 [Stygiomarasmius scandens]|uniref:F-box domain-containing protein n=1 Tax=Marasmiellus scandens TaxID=2682957 RepID=A0ABR1IXH0_9AGAR
MHHVFQIPELLHPIIYSLERDDQVQCALVCRSWSEIALDIIWDEVDDFRKLANILSPVKKQISAEEHISYIFDPTPGPQRWMRFQTHYSRRIKVLKFETSKDEHDLSPLLSSIQRIRSSQGILPNLRELAWTGFGSTFEDMMMFMHGNIKQLYLYPSYTSDLDPSWLPLLCEAIKVYIPGLTNLTIYAYPEQEYVISLVDLLKSLPNLTDVNVPAFRDISSVLSSLDGSLALRRLSFDAYSEDIAVTLTGHSPVNLPSLDELEFYVRQYQKLGQLLRANQFRSLTSLMLVTISIECPASIKAILNHISYSFPSLERLELSYISDLLEEHPDIQDPPSETAIITLDDLIPVLSCTKISSFILEHPYPLNLSDSDIRKIALAWRNLKTLWFSSTPLTKSQWSIKITLWGILFLVHQCPDLEELSLQVNTKLENMSPLDCFSCHAAEKVAALTEFDVGNSPIESEDVNNVVVALSRFCSPECQLKWDEESGESHWQKVEDLLPPLSKMQSTIREQSERIGFLERRLASLEKS